MGRPTKHIAEENAAFGWGPLREYWREINRQTRKAQAQARAQHKVRDKRRPKCSCQAYLWPHRPGGGLCRWPDPPVQCWQPKPAGRPYRKRYAGIRRQIARANGFHPIRDRAAIAELMPQALALAKQLHHMHPKYKYRNVQITETGIEANWQTAGPTM